MVLQTEWSILLHKTRVNAGFADVCVLMQDQLANISSFPAIRADEISELFIDRPEQRRQAENEPVPS